VTASSGVPSQAKQRSLLPGRTGWGGAGERARAWAVDVQLLSARELVRVPAAGDRDHLESEHVRVEAIRPLVVGDRDDDVVEPCYSHSIVAGGFDVTSSTTRFTPGISFTMRLEIVSSRS
jgi:hypothetical protein